jgi:anti-anti-sigma factor
MQLTVVHEKRGDAAVVRFGGEVDLAVDKQFRSHLATGLELASGCPQRLLIVELSAVGFCGSSGLQALLQCQAEGASRNVAICVAGASRIVERILRATGLDNVLDLRPTIDDAPGSLGTESGAP